MKKIIIIVSAVLLIAVIAVLSTLGGIGYFSYKAISEEVHAPAAAADGTITVMSANIRRQEKFLGYNSTFWTFDTGDHRWYKRAKYYLQNIAEVQPDIFGAQEVQPGQYAFLTEHLKGYGSVVTYRDDKGSRSESCPIFYNEARFTLKDSGTFWLSETPEKMSISWKTTNDQHRIATYVELEEKTTHDTVVVFNTHPDFAEDNDEELILARKEELKVLADKAAQMLAAGKKVIVFGDLNSDRSRQSGREALAPLDAILKNAIDLTGEDYGYTFNGYDIDTHEKLDYFYLSEGIRVEELKKLDKTYDGVFPSDHFPIYMKIKLG